MLGKLAMLVLMRLMMAGFCFEGWRFDDGMLPVNTAGSPGGGLQWPSDGDVVESTWQQ